MSHKITTEIDDLFRGERWHEEKQNYHQTIDTLFALLRQANLADSPQAQAWQITEDCYGSGNYLYSHIRDAIVAIAGLEIIEHESDCGEINYSLANRLK
jgi:hypothetical protein